MVAATILHRQLEYLGFGWISRLPSTHFVSHSSYRLPYMGRSQRQPCSQELLLWERLVTGERVAKPEPVVGRLAGAVAP